MLFVELGREVSPRIAELRDNKAAITGIINNKFVVIIKQDKTSEVVRLKDLVLNEKVYSMDELKNGSADLFKPVEPKKKLTDFDRFKLNLEQKVVSELLKAKGINN